MKSDGEQISRNAKWAIAQTIISAVVLFVLYRFLLNELGAEKLGLWALILASTSLAKIGELGFSSATLRFVGKYVGASQPDAAAEILETALLSIALPFAMLLAIAVPSIGFILSWFVPEQHMADALVILPWAMLGLWLSITSGLVQSAVDGSGRMDQRNMVLICTNVLYLALSLLLSPMLGLKGVAIAQAVQAGASLLLMWSLIRAQLQHLPLVPWRWRKKRFSEIAGFALSMQLGSVAGIFVEPITKALISRYAWLELLAYYEMANQVITRVRSVLISGFQAITPQFAITTKQSIHRKLFLKSQKKVIDIGIPFMSVLMISFPLISQIWIGREDSYFIFFGQIVGMTWLLNTLLMPAYFFLAGTGRGIPIAIGQVMTLSGTVLFGWIGGRLFPEVGSIIGASIALILGNIYFYKISADLLFCANHGIRLLKWIFNRGFVKLMIGLSMIGIASVVLSYVNGFVGDLIVFFAVSVLIAWLAFNGQPKEIRG